MKANELRIGNWINSQFGGIQEVVDVMCDGVNTLKYEGINYEFINPIPLTEEWLLKFGFEKDFDGSFMFGIISIFKDKRLKQNVYIYTESTYKYSDGQWVVILDLKLQYVHQLQNLYFALTGEELTLKNEQR